MDNNIKEIIEEYLKQNNILIDNNILIFNRKYKEQYVNQLNNIIIDINNVFNTNILKELNIKYIVNTNKLTITLNDNFKPIKIIDQRPYDIRWYDIEIKYNKQNQIILYEDIYNQYKYKFIYKNNDIFQISALNKNDILLETLNPFSDYYVNILHDIKLFINQNMIIYENIFDLEIEKEFNPI